MIGCENKDVHVTQWQQSSSPHICGAGSRFDSYLGHTDFSMQPVVFDSLGRRYEYLYQIFFIGGHFGLIPYPQLPGSTRLNFQATMIYGLHHIHFLFKVPWV